jgi:hypothetical protein
VSIECYYSECLNNSHTLAKHHDDIVDEPICTLDHCIASEEELLAYQRSRQRAQHASFVRCSATNMVYGVQTIWTNW